MSDFTTLGVQQFAQECYNLRKENQHLRDEVARLKVYLIREIARRKKLLHDCVGPDFSYTRGGVEALQGVREFLADEAGGDDE